MGDARDSFPETVSVSPSSSGGGFRFDADKLTSAIQRWEAFRDSLEEDRYHAERMANIEAPGLEFASGDFTDLANPSGEGFLEANKKMREYVGDYIDTLKAAQQRIRNREELSSGDVAASAEQLA
ncbi:hypothetical protein ABZ639_15430 [Saccharomonospora sp. NPDC006951]